MTDTFIDELEEIVDEVADSIATEVQAIVDALAPDGRAFGTELKSTEEQLAEYRIIRNDVEQWKLWVSNKALEITTNLQQGMVAQEKIDQLNPLSIAMAFMRAYSAKMEKLLEERML